MILFIIILACFLMSLFLVLKFRDSYGASFLEVIGFVGSLLFGCWLVVHIIVWAMVPYTFNIWETERQSFVETLQNARDNGRDLEAAAITKEVSKWNQDLARNKYENTIWFYDWCIDDRVNDLQPIN